MIVNPKLFLGQNSSFFQSLRGHSPVGVGATSAKTGHFSSSSF